MVLADPIERQSIQWLHAMPVSVDRPEKVAEALDAHLKQQATELRLRLLNEDTCYPISPISQAPVVTAMSVNCVCQSRATRATTFKSSGRATRRH
jgi:hypothetical protein